MPKIDITNLDEYEDTEESFEKMRSKKPKQRHNEERAEKKNHCEKKIKI